MTNTIQRASIPEKEVYSLIEQLSFAYNYSKEISKQPHLTEQTDIDSIEVQKIRADFPIFQNKQGNKPLIWLDNAATTQKPNVVIDAIKKFYEQQNSNIHRGNYDLSREATENYEDVRSQVAKFIGASSSEEIIFVRGSTEGINLIANTFGKTNIGPGDEVIVTLLEHHSNILPWKELCKKTGAILKVVPINKAGEVILSDYEKLLGPKTKLVALTQVSNAIGSVLPVETMIKQAKRYNATVMVDGAQSTPHQPVNVAEMDCDFYVFSGHKLFAPTGIGVVYGKKEILQDLPPWQVGGGMIEYVSFSETRYAASPYRFEAGTGNIAAVMGLGAALQYLSAIGMDRIAQYENKLLNYAIKSLQTVPGIVFMGTPEKRAGVISFILSTVDNDRIGSFLNDHGIALRVGHHCAQPTMQFFGVTGMVRASFAFYNTVEEIDFFVSTLHQLVERSTTTSVF